MSEEPSRSTGPYKPIALLSSGAQADVWQAVGPDGPVALKMLRHNADPSHLAREIRVLQSLRHSGLSSWEAHDEQEGWLALRFEQGEPIDAWAKEQPVAAIVDVFAELCDVVQYLHDQGVVHGDIKPSNILVTPSASVKLLDLGIAFQSGETHESFRGTLGFAAPELLRGDAPSAASDLYALGATLYACLSGRLPIHAEDPVGLAHLPLISIPLPVNAFRTDCPADLSRCIDRLLLRRAASRPVSASALKRALDQHDPEPAAQPVIGMLDARREIHQAIAAVADGESRAVVVYGPLGTGRRTIIREAVRVASAQGIAYRSQKGPQTAAVALAWSGDGQDVVSRAADQLAKPRPTLLLIHHTLPLLALPKDVTHHISPPTWSEQDVTQWAVHRGVALELATAWHRTCQGWPGWMQARHDAETQRRPTILADPMAQKILDHVEQQDSRSHLLHRLARELGIREDLANDYAVLLIAGGALKKGGQPNTVVAADR